MSKQADILLAPAFKAEMHWPNNLTDEDRVDFESEQTYQTNDTYLKHLNNVWISPDSVIYKNGLLIKASLPSKDHTKYYEFRHFLKKTVRGKKKILDRNKKYLLITDLWSAGHFHWFCDILPKLTVLGGNTREFVLLLQDSSYLRTIGAESFEKLQIAFEDIVWMRTDSFYKARNLFFISSLSPSGRMHPELIKKLRHRLIGDGHPGNKRIYISRHKASYRKVLNEDALFVLLREYGFEMLHAEGLTLSDQISIFSSAEKLISIHGAGLTNCIFMHPVSKVVELRRREGGGGNVGYWHLADSLGHQFYYYNGITDSDQPLVGRGCNLTVPLADFEQQILVPLQK